MGGYHHAKRAKASGFCYVNDIVLSLLRLQEVYDRILYIDIDVHHGDGVEEAFYDCSSVMTYSLHQFEDKFFPGTGSIESVGKNEGSYYSVNVPLKAGCNDKAYKYLFDTIFDKIVEVYRPNVIWL